MSLKLTGIYVTIVFILGIHIVQESASRQRVHYTCLDYALARWG